MHDCWVSHVLSYQSTLKLLFQEFNDSDPEAQLSSITTRIMQAVQYNLDGKSKQYKDPGLTQLFLMNNIHYIVRSVRRSEAKDSLGDDWVQILQCLSVQCSTSSGGGIPVGVR